MKTYLLDTSVIIDYLRGKQETVERVHALDGRFTSSIVCLAELYEGVYRVHNPQQVKETVENFFSSLSQVYSLSLEIAEVFGKLRAELKQRGEGLEDLDLLIAATCLSEHIPLVTQNTKHFSRVPHLLLV